MPAGRLCVKRRRRLVEQQHQRPQRNGNGQLNALRLSALHARCTSTGGGVEQRQRAGRKHSRRSGAAGAWVAAAALPHRKLHPRLVKRPLLKPQLVHKSWQVAARPPTLHKEQGPVQIGNNTLSYHYRSNRQTWIMWRGSATAQTASTTANH